MKAFAESGSLLLELLCAVTIWLLAGQWIAREARSCALQHHASARNAAIQSARAAAARLLPLRLQARRSGRSPVFDITFPEFAPRLEVAAVCRQTALTSSFAFYRCRLTVKAAAREVEDQIAVWAAAGDAP